MYSDCYTVVSCCEVVARFKQSRRRAYVFYIRVFRRYNAQGLRWTLAVLDETVLLCVRSSYRGGGRHCFRYADAQVVCFVLARKLLRAVIALCNLTVHAAIVILRTAWIFPDASLFCSGFSTI